jgi:lambda family phage tail tape measure protein
MAETGELLGTARVSLVMDADQWDAEVQRAKNRAAELGTTGESAFNKLSAAEKRATESALRMAQGFGKTREEMRLVELQAKGALPAAIEKAREAMERTRRASDQGAISFNKYGLSAKQNVAALRQVPAQLTDIFTGLAGGQNPLLVLLQQGGQLRDVFGGIVPAARALGGALLGLVNPATLTAAAVFGLGAAWFKGQKEMEAFNAALIKSGGFAADSGADLAALSAEMDNLAGVTRGEASAALAAVAESGKFTSEQLRDVTEAALMWSEATGESVESIVAEFEKLRKDPVEALLKLNEQWHFLTEAQIENVAQLVETGRETEAVTEAYKLFHDTIASRTPAMAENLNWLGRLMRGLKNNAGELIDSFANIGRAATAVDKLTAAQRQYEAAAQQNFGGARNRKEVEFWAGRVRELQGEINRSRVAAAFDLNQKVLTGDVAADSDSFRDRKKAEEEFARLALSNLSKREKLEAEIKKIRELGLKAGKDEAAIEKEIANARARYAESLPKAKKDRKETDPTEAIIQRLRQQIALNEEQVKSEDRLTATERLLVQVRTDLEKIGAKGSKTNKALIETLIDQAKASGEAAEKAMLEVKAKEALARQNAILEQQGATRARSNELDLMQFGRGSDVVAQLRRQLEVQREYQDELKRLGDRSVADDKETWDRLAENAAKHRDEQLRLERAYQERRLEMMGDWRNGYQKAFEDYLASVQDISGQSYDFFNNTFEGLTDAVVGFAKGSEDAFDDLLDYWYEAALRFLSDQAIAAFLKAIGGGGGGDQSASNNYGELAGTILDFFSSANSGFGFAKGGAFDRGAERFAKGGAFTNTIVSKPTNFRFAKGIGLMGEEGPEAIMPLRRLPDGRLGVESVRNGGANGTQTNNYTVNVPIYGKATADTRSQAANSISREIRNASRFRQ